MVIAEGIFFIPEDKKICRNCKHFWQHYVYSKSYDGYMKYTPCNAGHCAIPRLKNRSPEHKACVYFEWKKGDSNV